MADEEVEVTETQEILAALKIIQKSQEIVLAVENELWTAIATHDMQRVRRLLYSFGKFVARDPEILSTFIGGRVQ